MPPPSGLITWLAGRLEEDEQDVEACACHNVIISGPLSCSVCYLERSARQHMSFKARHNRPG